MPFELHRPVGRHGRESTLVRVVREVPTPEQLRACTGDSHSEELRTLYRLAVGGDGKLRVRYPLGTMTVARNAAGECGSFALDTGRVRGLRFVRVDLTPR